ncbi:MAG: GNAT family N-acetyltransferase [Ilumatobacteraceae bacterium]
MTWTAPFVPVTIAAPQSGLGRECREVLASVPTWFGIPESNEEYIGFVDANPTWAAIADDGSVVGLLAPLRHAPSMSMEIYLLAVRPEWHRHGVGRALVEAFEQAARAEGMPMAQVKTLGPSHPDEGYALTRQFYAAMGYRAVEEFHDLWPGTPALLMVKPLPPPTGEAAVVARTEVPVTAEDIGAALRGAGLRRGSVAVVHSSLSTLGWVVGGAHAVVAALFDVVGPEGTIVMPAHSSHLSEPSKWENPPVPETWWQVIRDHMPAFDAHLTPPIAMGSVAECFLCHPSTVRSAHPSMSFAANGPLAAQIVAMHPIDDCVGEASPLGRLYEIGAGIVLLGVGHGNNTSLHFAETRTEWARAHRTTYAAPVLVDGSRQWVEYEDIDLDSDDFAALGEAFAATGGETRVPLGSGEVIACDLREIVDFAIPWLDAHRTG